MYHVNIANVIDPGGVRLLISDPADGAMLSDILRVFMKKYSFLLSSGLVLMSIVPGITALCHLA